MTAERKPLFSTLPLRERAVQMRADGKPWAEIKATLGITQGALQNFLKGNKCVDCGTVITAKATRCGSCRSSQQGQTWTKEKVRNSIAAFFVEHGRAPTAREWSTVSPDRPSAFDAINRFGSFNAAVSAAGLTPRRSGQQVSHAGGHRKYRPSVANGDSAEAELAHLISEQERDHRFGHRSLFIPFDGNDFRMKNIYSDDWTVAVCDLLDRRAQVDRWVDEWMGGAA